MDDFVGGFDGMLIVTSVDVVLTGELVSSSL